MLLIKLFPCFYFTLIIAYRHLFRFFYPIDVWKDSPSQNIYNYTITISTITFFLRHCYGFVNFQNARTSFTYNLSQSKESCLRLNIPTTQYRIVNINMLVIVSLQNRVLNCKTEHFTKLTEWCWSHNGNV